MITIVTPIGPYEANQRWFEQYFLSVRSQLKGNDEILLINDMASLKPEVVHLLDTRVKVWNSPWLLGPGCVHNIGVSLASNNLCLFVASDDWLAPDCLDTLRKYWNQHPNPLGYYSLTIRYYDEATKQLGEIQSLPCAAAMVHKDLWHHTGGFPPESSSGASDAAFLSIMLGAQGRAGTIYNVAEGTPLYYVRCHNDQDTNKRGPWQEVILKTRNILTRQWQPPRWGRYDVLP